MEKRKDMKMEEKKRKKEKTIKKYQNSEK